MFRGIAENRRERAIWLPKARRAAAIIGCTILVGCASDGHHDSAELTPPAVASNIYSYANMQVMLVTIPDMENGCGKSACDVRAQFDRRVSQIGSRLANAAYAADPELIQRVPHFDFSVLDKEEPGTASTANGHVVVLRPVGGIARGDAALSFVIAREIGHVALEHHKKNMAISLAVSVLTSILAPAINITKLFAVAFSGTTSTAATASMTAASFAGSRAVIESYRPQRRDEADAFAMRLLSRVGYDARDVAAGFSPTEFQSASNEWMRGLQASVKHLKEEAGRPEFVQPAQPVPAIAAIAAVE